MNHCLRCDEIPTHVIVSKNLPHYGEEACLALDAPLIYAGYDAIPTPNVRPAPYYCVTHAEARVRERQELRNG